MRRAERVREPDHFALRRFEMRERACEIGAARDIVDRRDELRIIFQLGNRDVPPMPAAPLRIARQIRRDAKQRVAAIVIVIALLTTIGGASLRALKSLVHMPSAATLAQWNLPIGVMIVMLIAFTPVALYLAIARD